MTTQRNFSRFMFGIIAASVMAFSACGGSGGQADAVDDGDAHAVTDTVGSDAVQSDANGRDVGDVVAGDTAVDAIVDAADVGADVPVDAVIDVPSDATQGDTVDALCVPDCSGGACSDDGCGGDCCDAPNVCDKNYAGTGLLCLPQDGTTCVEIGQCSTNCSDQACIDVCYNAGSAAARDAIWAIMNCINIACPEHDSECVIASYEDGGSCYAEYSACMNGCTPNCAGGPCTDDGCGGDCCDAPNACQVPESGVGLECLPVEELTCKGIWACAVDCQDETCAQNCINRGGTEAQTQLNNLLDCLRNVCTDGTEECITAAVQPGADCFDSYVACT